MNNWDTEKNTMDTKLDISVVIPVYNSEDCLDELTRRLTDVLDKVGKVYEIILINDCSQDDSWTKITQCCKVNNKIRAINFRKNFGQDNAIMAGLKYSSGKSIIIMDDDLQHDPEDIAFLLNKLTKGYDVVYANFHSKKQSLIKNFGSWFNGKVAEIVINKPKGIYLSPYKAIKREIVKEIIKYEGPYPYVDGLIFRITQNITQITAIHYKRYTGKGNYGLRKSILVWMKLVTNFSVLPLRFATFIGFVSAGLGFILGLVYILQHFMGYQSPSGWASQVVIILFMGGVQLLTIGIVGEYIGRMFLHNSKEPQYIINEIIEDSSGGKKV
jgi:polyisoprenyl-phosphate glycosyltransferase